MRPSLLIPLIACLPGFSLAQVQPERQGLADMLMEYAAVRFPGTPLSEHILYVSVRRQRLYHVIGGRMGAEYTISTSAKGLGSLDGSERTPEGLHRVAEKIGQGVPPGGWLRDRVFAGQYARAGSGEDMITARILWLQGMENGRNAGGGRDSYSRAIYIHGTPYEEELGRPASHGCIRMGDEDIIPLFDQVPVGTLVFILDN